jgi:hypothetical protein
MNALTPTTRALINAPRIIIVSAADSRFIHFLKGLIESLGPVLSRPNVDFACFDIGLDPIDRNWLANYTDVVLPPHAHLGIDADAHPPALLSFLARPFLREYFPGYDVYVWIDSDIWLQDPEVITAYVNGARSSGMAITHEEERAYRFQPWLFGWTAKHFLLGYGAVTAAYLLARPHVNAGFFALAADAPQWEGWAHRYETAIRRTGALVPHDQFALNHSLHAREGRRAPAMLLDPGFNWICERGVPMWNDAKQVYCKPYAPYERIGALHLAGPAKRKAFTVRRTGGGEFTTYILRGTSPANPVTRPLLDVPAAG